MAEKSSARPVARKAKSGQSGQGWNHREALVALITLIIAAVSVVVSAISTALTYQQVKLINRERLTPYRAILYSAKLEAYRELMSAYDIWNSELSQPRSTVSAYLWHLGQRRIRPSWSIRSSIRESARAVHEDGISISGRFSATLNRTSVVWPRNIANEMIETRHRSDALSICFHVPRYEAVPQILLQRCTAQQFYDNGEAVRSGILRVETLMREDLRADQLQSISPDNPENGSSDPADG